MAMSTDQNNRPWPMSRFPGLLFGADYNPEQWTPAMGYEDEAIWLEDMRLMAEAGVNTATVGVFSWALLQPNEQTFTFTWLDRLLDLLAEHGIAACLATGTAAQPAWLSQAYPEVLPVNAFGQRQRHGGRMNFCPTSPVFRRFSQQLVRALAERYRNHPALLIWHISNEYGPQCYCDQCAARFRIWLRESYGDLAELNRRWLTPFWGHVFTAWDQIEPPSQLGDRSMQGLILDYQRFMSAMNLECYQAERAILREITPDVPAMTNFHGLVKNLDYFAWAPFQDIITWDSYPPANEAPGRTAFRLALMRGLKHGQPWLLLEQTPSQTQWRPFNPLKRPGVMRLQSYQAIAHGSEGAMYFQWRQARGSSEMHHGAIVSHAGSTQTRTFQEVAALGAELRSLGTKLLGARVPARVAMLFSWPNWWAVEYQPGLSSALDYLDEVMRYYAALWPHNVAVDICSPNDSLAGYDLVIAPLLYLLEEPQAAAIEQYISAGGVFLTSYFSAIVDHSGKAWLGGSPGPLRRALGIWVEEVDPLLPDQHNHLIVPESQFVPAGAYDCDLWCEVLHLEGAQAIAQFGDDFYAGQPAISEHHYGAGRSYYVATRPEARLLESLLGAILDSCGITAPLAAPAGVEVVERATAEGTWTFVLNHSTTEQIVPLPQPMQDLLTQQQHDGSIQLASSGVAILVALTPAAAGV
jgi:beta-galactosidase